MDRCRYDLVLNDLSTGNQFTIYSATQSVIEGSGASLRCNYSTPASIIWEKNNGSLPSSVEVRMLSPSASELTIPAANHAQHAGEYRCVANSSAGTQISPSITLFVYCE